jgi:hypothetical protein
MRKIPVMAKLERPALLREAFCLVPTGKLAISANNFVYLNIDDGYVHRLFPLLQQDSLIKKPDYFGEGLAGAHISVVYPEENRLISQENLNNEYPFKIKELVAADIDSKKYYVLLVESSGLLQLRREIGLSDKLCSYKGYLIDLHITIGVSAAS